jgi:predicted ArsR family transcriptional regulator
MTNTRQIKETLPKVRTKSTSSAAPPKRATQKDQLIRLLRARSGVEITVISEKLGWQKHTARAALTRLRRAEYQLVTLIRTQDKPTRYRITTMPSATVAGRAQVMTNG